MRYSVKDNNYKFIYAFDTETGLYIRSDILDGPDKGKEPFMGSYPHLIDVGIMGHCIHGKTGLCAKAGIGCYQSGLMVEEPNMTVENFRRIAEESKHLSNQFALGGRGDPDQHEHFEEILQICKENDIVPNFTTSGYGMTEAIARLCKEYCGAVAVSWYRSEYTLKAIEMLLNAGVKTNIHYVLGNNSIDEAIERLENNDFPKVNAVIFLLHKPAGQGTQQNVLSVEDERVARFFSALEAKHPFKVGLDSCTVPGALKFCKHIMPSSLDTCEGGRFSCYIGADMVMVPCSFDQSRKYAVSLEDMSIEAAWNSAPFEQFRSHMRNACPECSMRESCLGGCPLMPEVVLCREKKNED